MALTLEKAEKIVQGAVRKARELGILITVAIVDDGGHVMALSRMDGARFATEDLAPGKAFTAAALQRESALLSQMSPFFAGGPELSSGRLVALPGGLPIREGDQVVGAVGVGGGTGEQDVECAQAGIAVM